MKHRQLENKRPISLEQKVSNNPMSYKQKGGTSITIIDKQLRDNPTYLDWLKATNWDGKHHL